MQFFFCKFPHRLTGRFGCAMKFRGGGGNRNISTNPGSSTSTWFISFNSTIAPTLISKIVTVNICFAGIEKMTEKSPASAAHNEQQTLNPMSAGDSAVGGDAVQSVQPEVHGSLSVSPAPSEQRADSQPDGQPQNPEETGAANYSHTEGDTSGSVSESPSKLSTSHPSTEDRPPLNKASSLVSIASNFLRLLYTLRA